MTQRAVRIATAAAIASAIIFPAISILASGSPTDKPAEIPASTSPR